MQVIHVSVECFPVAKVGGLADVVGALPKYQRQLGIDASVVMPWFDRPFVRDNSFDVVAQGSFLQGSEPLEYTVYKESKDSLGFPLYLVKIPGKLDREEVYCYPDEAEQWIAFQHAFLHWITTNDIHPDILHTHDHHVGLIPFLAQNGVHFEALSNVRTVHTVHNGQYQGWMSWNKGVLLPAFDTWKWGLLDWDGLINPLAAAIKCCDAFTAVSEGYLKELYQEANGLQGLFRHEADKSLGIVNGIDTAYWNPQTDSLIASKYYLRTVESGKQKNRAALCKEFGLDDSLPLLSFIGRFAAEKGADLLAGIIEKILSANENKIAIFILGSGDQQIQEQLAAMSGRFDNKLEFYFGYNESLAHLVYAASDLLLMPSRVEPCGLNQLYALKYGTIPIVRGVGGLKDTVIDVEQEEGYGFVFSNLNVDDAVETIHRSLTYFDRKKEWKEIRKNAMSLDFSWDSSAQKYIDLYNQLLK